MARVYIAGSYDRRSELFERAKDLVQAGHTVTSRWLKGNDALPKQDQIDMDLVDLLSADTVVSFAGGGTTGGRHFELGYAAAMNDNGDYRALLLVGPEENLFHFRSDILPLPDFRAVVVFLAFDLELAGAVMARARRLAAAL